MDEGLHVLHKIEQKEKRTFGKGFKLSTVIVLSKSIGRVDVTIVSQEECFNINFNEML